ncbi:MAG: acyltransferase family protein, partial [Verrucomicrobiales bacterium]|nr:acyltransferase family protein [Verrucomicrobiales bacterium]
MRLLLAAAVVIGHTAPIDWLPMAGAGMAVKLFFVVSGFYMGMILTEKYADQLSGRWLFYSNRFLRIYPLFWIVLILEVVSGFVLYTRWPVDGSWLALQHEMAGRGQWSTLALYNGDLAGLLGVEWFSLFSWSPDGGLTPHVAELGGDAVRGWRPLIMPHAWTLSCELCFYAVAPWIVKWRTSMLVMLVVVSVSVINTLHLWVPVARAELLVDYAFPFQIGFFGLGLLGYRLMRAKATWLSG